MACVDCGNDCILISSKCICTFTPLKGFTEQDLSECYHAANMYLNGITGSCDLCDKFEEVEYLYADIISTKEFRAFMSNLIYNYWMRLRGTGAPTKEGFTTKEEDSFSSFRVNNEKELQAKINNHAPILQMYEAAFMAKFKDSFSSCYNEDCCTCNGDCVCGKRVTDGSSLVIFGYNNEDDDLIYDDFAIV